MPSAAPVGGLKNGQRWRPSTPGFGVFEVSTNKTGKTQLPAFTGNRNDGKTMHGFGVA
jgi:hypothetical protein